MAQMMTITSSEIDAQNLRATQAGAGANDWASHVNVSIICPEREYYTHLHNKTDEEVESSHSDEQHLVAHVSEVVQFKKLANCRCGIQHQPSHDGEEDQQ